MKKIKLLFYVEHLEREIDTIQGVIECLSLSKEDYRVVSTNFAMGISKLLYSPELVITPWMYSDYCYKKILPFAFTNKTRVLNLHHEQITNQDRMNALLPSGNAREGYHISWGGNFRDKLISIGVEQDKIFVTGSTRLKVSKPLSSKHDIASNVLGNKKFATIPWIMFASSYSWKDLPDSVIKKVEKNGRKNVWEYKDIVRNSYNETLEWIVSFLDVNKEILYLYRLHPSENKDNKLKEIEDKYPNFIVISDLSISEWIPHCEVVDVWISTSIAEIFAYTKPVRIIRPITLPSNVEVEGFEQFDKLESKDDFINVDIKEGSYNLKNANEYLYYFYSYGVDSKRKLAESIEAILSNEPDEIEITKLNKVNIISMELIKDIVKILLIKTNLIRFTPYARLKKSFFIILGKL